MSPRNRPRRRPSLPRSGGLARRVAAWALRAAAAALVLQHLELLVRRFADATIAEPLVLLRWLGAVAVVAGGLALHRRGRAPWRGRSGLAFTLVVLLLHAGGGVPAAPNLADTLLVLPAGLLAVALAAALVDDRRAATAPAPLLATSRRRRPDPPRVSTSAGFLRLFAPRPPPSSLVAA